MDLTLIGYTASLFAALLAMSTYSHWGTAEVHTYSIPPYLEERGYSPQIVANQVVDSMRRIQIEVASLKEANVVVQGQRVQPVGEVASYFGFVELMRAAETALGLDPTAIEIEITQHGEVAHWRTRGDHAVRGFQVRQGDVPLDDPDALIAHLGLQVLGYVSPFEALSYNFLLDSSTGKYETTVDIASSLLVDCDRYRAWSCTEANIKNAYLLRGMAFLYSDRSSRAFDDFDAANKIGSASALSVAFYGDAFAALGQNEAAQRQYERAKQLDPDIGERFYEYGKGYAVGGNHLLAHRRFEAAADLGENSESFLVDWGDTLAALGQHEAALEKYRSAEAANTETDLYADRIDRTLKALQAAHGVAPAPVPLPGQAPAVAPVPDAAPDAAPGTAPTPGNAPAPGTDPAPETAPVPAPAPHGSSG